MCIMDLNYSLPVENYSFSNAMLWGNCCKHWEQGQVAGREGRLGDKAVHILICLAEALPVVSQIASLFEMIIVKCCAERRLQPPPLLLPALPRQIVPIPEFRGETFKEFKQHVLQYLPQHMGNERIQRTHLRVLQSIAKPNPIVRLREQEGFAKQATIYRYNAYSIRDYGWGCAWRAIQTCMSTFGVHEGFDTLFHLFGRYEILREIYRDKYPGEDLANPVGHRFAPYETPNAWAEPFIGEMALRFYGIDSDLDIVNGIPRHCAAPHQVFHRDPHNFATFKQKLLDHFSSDLPAPVMIDDGVYALTIIGIHENESGDTILTLADPHIEEGIADPEDRNPYGIYTVTLNEQGQQTSCSLDHEDNYQIPSLFHEGISARAVSFDSHQWMALFPKGRL